MPATVAFPSLRVVTLFSMDPERSNWPKLLQIENRSLIFVDDSAISNQSEKTIRAVNAFSTWNTHCTERAVQEPDPSQHQCQSTRTGGDDGGWVVPPSHSIPPGGLQDQWAGLSRSDFVWDGSEHGLNSIVIVIGWLCASNPGGQWLHVAEEPAHSSYAYERACYWWTRS